MAERKRDAIAFVTNDSQCVALEKTDAKEVAYGKWMYLLTDNRIMFVPQVCAVQIGNFDPQPGEEFYVTRREIREGKRVRLEWHVSQEPITHNHEPGANTKPGDTLAAAAATGIPESDLERQLRESNERKAISRKTAERIMAKANLEQRGDAIPEIGPENVAPELIPVLEEAAVEQMIDRAMARDAAVDRKPPQMAQESTPPPPSEPTAPPAPERYIWMPNLVEVCRSYTFKLNVGNYESRDFFCAQKAECRPEDADLVSAKLYEFCKAQVMKAVAAETGRKTA